jgi:hypothetical protein
MRNYVLLSALVCFLQMPALAQDIIGTTGQSLQGTWIVQTTDASGNVSLFEIESTRPTAHTQGPT